MVAERERPGRDWLSICLIGVLRRLECPEDMLGGIVRRLKGDGGVVKRQLM